MELRRPWRGAALAVRRRFQRPTGGPLDYVDKPSALTLAHANQRGSSSSGRMGSSSGCRLTRPHSRPFPPLARSPLPKPSRRSPPARRIANRRDRQFLASLASMFYICSFQTPSRPPVSDPFRFPPSPSNRAPSASARCRGKCSRRSTGWPCARSTAIAGSAAERAEVYLRNRNAPQAPEDFSFPEPKRRLLAGRERGAGRRAAVAAGGSPRRHSPMETGVLPDDGMGAAYRPGSGQRSRKSAQPTEKSRSGSRDRAGRRDAAGPDESNAARGPDRDWRGFPSNAGACAQCRGSASIHSAAGRDNSLAPRAVASASPFGAGPTRLRR